jgi:protein-tyrosine phosphatase
VSRPQKKVLVVCLGNICRSPLAEAILQKEATDAGLNWVVESAGTNHYHIGEPPHHLSQKVALMNGYDISHQRARQFRTDDFENFDMIYALANDVRSDIIDMAGASYRPEKLDLFLQELYPGKEKDVPDPWYGPEPGYHEVFRLIEEAARAIVHKQISTHP